MRPPWTATALAQTICRFARLAADVPELAELEVNPLVAGPAGVVAVDARGKAAAGGTPPAGERGGR